MSADAQTALALGDAEAFAATPINQLLPSINLPGSVPVNPTAGGVAAQFLQSYMSFGSGSSDFAAAFLVQRLVQPSNFTGAFQIIGQAISNIADDVEDIYSDIRYGNSYQQASGYGSLVAGAGAAIGTVVLGRFGMFGISSDLQDASISALNSNNNINLLRLNYQLNVQDTYNQIFTDSGALKTGIINNSDLIVLGSDLENEELVQDLTSNGTNISDWNKYSSPTIMGPSGGFQVHYYWNSATGDFYYGQDYKSVFNHQGIYTNVPPPKFTISPGSP